MLLEAVLQCQVQALLQKRPSLLVLADHVGSANIIQGMDQGLDISHLPGKRKRLLPPADGLRRVFFEQSKLGLVAVGHR